MTTTSGRFVWHALHTQDLLASRTFYAGVAGWTVRDTLAGGLARALFSAHSGASVAVATAVGSDGAAEMTRGWIGYVAVDDLDATLETVVRLGGAVREAAVETADFGAFAVVADPQGALFGVMRPGSRAPSGGAGPGHFTWRELYSSDPDAACDFYVQALGWTKAHAFDMGPGGAYQMFAIDGQPAGGIMRAPQTMSGSAWNHFIQVQDIGAAEARIGAAGGHVFDGLREVPGGDWTVKGFDAQGALFALTGRNP